MGSSFTPSGPRLARHSIRQPWVLRPFNTHSRGATPLPAWYLGDGILDVNPHTSSPVPLAMPTIYPPMWFEHDVIEKGRRAEQRKHDEAVQLLHAGHSELAGRLLAELRTSLEERLQTVLYSEADCKFLRGEYQAALDVLNQRQILAPCVDNPDYKVHWMAGLCLANLGRLPEAILQLELARKYTPCARTAECITAPLSRLRLQLGMAEDASDF